MGQSFGYYCSKLHPIEEYKDIIVKCPTLVKFAPAMLLSHVNRVIDLPIAL